MATPPLFKKYWRFISLFYKKQSKLGRFWWQQDLVQRIIQGLSDSWWRLVSISPLHLTVNSGCLIICAQNRTGLFLIVSNAPASSAFYYVESSRGENSSSKWFKLTKKKTTERYFITIQGHHINLHLKVYLLHPHGLQQGLIGKAIFHTKFYASNMTLLLNNVYSQY